MTEESSMPPTSRIEPKVLKGFRDQLPNVTIPRQEMIRKIERVFARYGFAPIDTPALEYAEILLGKGGAESDKQLFRFTDQGGRDVALRFDLTVPLARFVAQHINDLGIPFKRYHIAPVWRAEKPQRGRYREFIQCDVDIIGTDSIIADAEILSVIHDALNELSLRHEFRINNRVLLNGLLHLIGADTVRGVVLRAIDKLEKLGNEVVQAELRKNAGLDDDRISRIFSLLTLSREKGDQPKELFRELRALLGLSKMALDGIAQVERLHDLLLASGMSPSTFRFDLSIARGLDYYTGFVFETTFLDMPEIGSVSSGGRYDDLASLYINRRLPGVGASIGLDRVLGALEELGRFGNRYSTAEAFIALVDEPGSLAAIRLASQLRHQGFNIEVYPEIGKVGNQLKYADRKGIPIAILIGEREALSNTATVKNLQNGEQREQVSNAELPQLLHFLLGR